MHGKRILRKLGVAGFFAAAFLFALSIQNSNAQTTGPEFMLTWQAANSYVPPSYAAKILPNQESPVTASVALISPQGQPIDLSGQTVNWYLDDNFLGGGIGAQKITFEPYGSAPSTLILKVELPDYPTGLLVYETSIPVVAPVAVIDAPFPANTFSAVPVAVQALPYFFNATSVAPLAFNWSVNGQTVANAENPEILQISLPKNTPSGFALGISLAIQDSNDSSVATANLNATYQP
jgi:hypothetical protein